MNRAIEIAAMVLGGLSLFAVCFAGFSTMAGVPLNEVPGVGALVPDPAEDEASDQAPSTAATGPPAPVRSRTDVLESSLGALGAWSLPAPYTADELRSLVEELKAKLLVMERREQEITRREEDLEQELESLGERFASLEQLRAELEEYERELDLREEEVLAAEGQAQERNQAKWQDVATVLTALDAPAAAAKLVQYLPDEAAQILRGMDDAKAASILNSVASDRWKEYVDAYTRTTTTRQ